VISAAATTSLAHLASTGNATKLDPVRVAEWLCSSLIAGCSQASPLLCHVGENHPIRSQRPDGGWSDVEETLWCLGYLKLRPDVHRHSVDAGLDWLKSQRSPEGGWGRTHRDRPRIPITGLACALCPEVVGEKDLEWLQCAWEADLNGPVQLTYKAGFFLLGCAHPLSRVNPALVTQTVEYVFREQSDDGGFGPWKDHPCGSDPWSTGVVLWGFSCVPDQAPLEVVRRAVAWLESAQLPNGLWPYHPIDEGSSLALIGLSKVLPLLDKAA